MKILIFYAICDIIRLDGGVFVKPKSINSLMAIMRDDKGININGSTQKKKLRYMGYYHGYKGYRYFNSPTSLLAYSNFNELQAVYNFDMKVKSILYPQIMFLETTLKNYALEIILEEAKSSRFADIYSKLLNDYKAYALGTTQYKNAINKRMDLRNKIYGNISRGYGKNNIISHYYDKGETVPMWAIFEIVSLGEFGNFLCCLNDKVRHDISSSVGVRSNIDADGRMIEKIIFTLKDLRNAVAHNNTVFDSRFKTGKVDTRINNYISTETRISNITFKTIVDYIILISFVLNLLKCNKNDILSFIRQFEDACESLRKDIPINIYSQIVYTDTRRKLQSLKSFLQFN